MKRTAAVPVSLIASWLIFLLTNALIFWSSTRPPTRLDAFFSPHDKICHFVTYGLLFLSTAFAFRSLIPLRPVAAVSIVYGLVIGLGTELLQSTVPLRQASFGDWLADAAGLIVTAGLGVGLRKRFPYGIF